MWSPGGEYRRSAAARAAAQSRRSCLGERDRETTSDSARSPSSPQRHGQGLAQRAGRRRFRHLRRAQAGAARPGDHRLDSCTSTGASPSSSEACRPGGRYPTGSGLSGGESTRSSFLSLRRVRTLLQPRPEAQPDLLLARLGMPAPEILPHHLFSRLAQVERRTGASENLGITNGLHQPYSNMVDAERACARRKTAQGS